VRSLLKKNAFINNCEKQILIIPYALSYRRYTTYITSNLFGKNHLTLTKSRNTQIIKTSTLDEEVARLKMLSVSLIKADIEGSEYNFLKGARRTLARFSPQIILEIDHRHLSRFNATPEDIFGLMAEEGYVCKYVFEGKRRRPFKHYIYSPVASRNYLFVKRGT
jgi:FkbM family methyltransferase